MESTNKNSKARIAANNRYNDKAYDRINIAVPKGRKDIIKSVADKYGMSVNGYICKLLDEAMEREQALGGGFRIPEPPMDSNI